jgi:hypothetical protein
MKKVISICVVISLLSVRCTSSSKESVKEEPNTHQQVGAHHHSSDEIELNNGEKWVVVPEMMECLKVMENEINTFSDGESNDYKQLSDNLLLNIDKLTSNCTMEGKAHDELHKWLLPYIELVNETVEKEKLEEQEEMLLQLKDSFKIFNQYFQ